MYVCMCMCEKIEFGKQDDAKGLLDIRDFQLSHQKNPCYRCFMKIHQHGAEIFNKTCNLKLT